MSRNYGQDLMCGIVEKTSIANELYDFFSCINNEDLNGNNGEEYLLEETVDRGLYSDIELFVKEAVECYPIDMRAAFEHICESIVKRDSCYESFESEIMEIAPDVYYCVVSFLTVS